MPVVCMRHSQTKHPTPQNKNLPTISQPYHATEDYMPVLTIKADRQIYRTHNSHIQRMTKLYQWARFTSCWKDKMRSPAHWEGHMNLILHEENMLAVFKSRYPLIILCNVGEKISEKAIDFWGCYGLKNQKDFVTSFKDDYPILRIWLCALWTWNRKILAHYKEPPSLAWKIVWPKRLTARARQSGGLAKEKTTDEWIPFKKNPENSNRTHSYKYSACISK